VYQSSISKKYQEEVDQKTDYGNYQHYTLTFFPAIFGEQYAE
jgi:hypothetical protein